MSKFTHVFTPLLICCYAIIAVLAVYQIYLMKRHLYNLSSFNAGFLCCCVPWCLLRISYWLVPTDSCANDTQQLLQGFMLELPINLEFVCFYLIMVYIMRQVRNSEGTWNREFRTWLKWVSIAAHVSFLVGNVATVVVSVTNGTREFDATDSDCVSDMQHHPEECKDNGGCFSDNATAANVQLGLSSTAFMLLALNLLYYGVKLHFNFSDTNAPRPARSVTDPTESIRQIAFGAGESPLVTEGICITLLVVFVSRSVFDAMQLDIFAPSPLSIPQDKDITNFWIFGVYMAWEVLPISLMLFFFGTTKPAPKPVTNEKRFQAYNQPMREGDDEVEDPVTERLEAENPAPNMYWPLPSDPMGSSFSGETRLNQERSYSPARNALARKEKSFMENENRYDSQPSTPQQQPMHGPGARQLQPVREGMSVLPQGRMGDRAFLYQLASGNG